MVACWECDGTANRPISVTIELPTGHRPRVQLCPSCYELHYLPLIAEMSADRMRQAPRRRHDALSAYLTDRPG